MMLRTDLFLEPWTPPPISFTATLTATGLFRSQLDHSFRSATPPPQVQYRYIDRLAPGNKDNCSEQLSTMSTWSPCQFLLPTTCSDQKTVGYIVTVGRSDLFVLKVSVLTMSKQLSEHARLFASPTSQVEPSRTVRAPPGHWRRKIRVPPERLAVENDAEARRIRNGDATAFIL
jgi:hypothetical protein